MVCYSDTDAFALRPFEPLRHFDFTLAFDNIVNPDSSAPKRLNNGMYVCMYVCMYVYVSTMYVGCYNAWMTVTVYMYECLCTPVCMRSYIYIHTYIHTCIHTYIAGVLISAPNATFLKVWTEEYRLFNPNSFDYDSRFDFWQFCISTLYEGTVCMYVDEVQQRRTRF